jgi:predicted glycoside hydrolase/deacetylase ChbG (UPF0249 family)
MCHGANRAFVELSEFGTVTAGSVMVPCPWFTEIAELAVEHDELDVGVHLTLNSEHPQYRWAPISDIGESSGLVDPHGYMWPSVSNVRFHAEPDAVETEWRAQIDKALAAGIDVTHLDAHMGAALAPEWCDRYVALGADYGVPVLITNTIGAYGPNDHLVGVEETDFAPFVTAARNLGMPIFDEVLETDFSRIRGANPDYESMLSDLDQDLVYCAFHPNAPGPGEIEFIEPDTNHVRIDEHQIFGQTSWKQWLDAQPFTLTSMRELRQEFRARLS